MQRIVIIIPALNPDIALAKLVSTLEAHPEGNLISHFIIINDGSAPEHSKCFDILQEYSNCVVLHHAVNLGKGRALKTGFNYCLQNFPSEIGAVTVDADGQHLTEDIISCAKKLIQYPNSIILGSRNFKDPSVPFRSKFGNILTSKITSFLCGLDISDTQTGLRGLPQSFMMHALNIPGERFEYEMHMLLESKQYHVPIQEVPITTVYLQNNESSHFNPILDSIKIYKVFGKFILSSVLSFLIDFLLFGFFIKAFKNSRIINYIMSATILARIISSIVNYSINKNVVFKENRSISTLFKYYILAIFQMLISGFVVNIFYQNFYKNELIIKLIVDTILFLFSFYIQRKWVFQRSKKGNNKI